MTNSKIPKKNPMAHIKIFLSSWTPVEQLLDELSKIRQTESI